VQLEPSDQAVFMESVATRHFPELSLLFKLFLANRALALDSFEFLK